MQGERAARRCTSSLAWVVVHLGGGLGALRGSLALRRRERPAIAASGAARGRGRLVAAAIASASWMLLFHGVYGRMYSRSCSRACFVPGAAVAVERGGAGRWALWGFACWLRSQRIPTRRSSSPRRALHVLARAYARRHRRARRGRVRCSPSGTATSVLRGRFDVGVGSGGNEARRAGPCSQYLWRVAGDFTAGRAVAPRGGADRALRRRRQLWVENRSRGESPDRLRSHRATLALTLADLGRLDLAGVTPSSSSFPFFACLVALGLIEAARGRLSVLVVATAALLAAEVAWGWDKTPALYEGEPPARVEAVAASAWLASTVARDDVLFGYEPLYLGAWERNRSGSRRRVVPGADAKLALESLRARPVARPRGLGLRRERHDNFTQSLEIPLRYSNPEGALRGAGVRPLPRHSQSGAHRLGEDVPRAGAGRRARRQVALHRRRGHQPRHRRSSACAAQAARISRFALEHLLDDRVRPRRPPGPRRVAARSSRGAAPRRPRSRPRRPTRPPMTKERSRSARRSSPSMGRL